MDSISVKDLNKYWKENMGERLELYLNTSGDWYGTYDGNKVKVLVMVLTSGDIRTAYWGNDDFGLTRDEKFSMDLYCQRMLELVQFKKEGTVITQEYLLSLGFVVF